VERHVLLSTPNANQTHNLIFDIHSRVRNLRHGYKIWNRSSLRHGYDHRSRSHSEAPSRTQRLRWLGMGLLFSFALLYLYTVRYEDDRRKSAPGGGHRPSAGPVTIVPATAKRGDINIYLDALGTVTPVHTASITSQVTGLVTAVQYREGQFVRKGDPLIQIDPREYQAQLVQAQGSLEHDTQVLEQAKMDLERYLVAWNRNAIARQQFEDQEKLVLQEQGTVNNDQGTVQYDTVLLSYCHITSPITGRVGLRLVDPGNLVTAGGSTTLVVVTQLQPITVVFTISEDDLAQFSSQIRHGAQLDLSNRQP